MSYKCCKKEKPHGAYTIEVANVAGSVCFHKGGTLTGSTGLDINFPDAFSENGNFGTTWSGDVTKVRCKTFKVVMTNVLSNKNDVGPATPFFRPKITLDIVFDDHYKTFNGTFTFLFFALSDLELKTPIGSPVILPIKGFKI